MRLLLSTKLFNKLAYNNKKDCLPCKVGYVCPYYGTNEGFLCEFKLLVGIDSNQEN